MSATPTLRILGIRGVPAAHGGFETFAERLALHLVDRGWRVIVYCQEIGSGPIERDRWRGIERVRIPSGPDTNLATMRFDWRSIGDARRDPEGVCLTLGYNTALFCLRLKLAGVRNLINMDGIEWRRAKWGPLARLWFWLNDWAGCMIGDHLIADHPEIQAHLCTRTSARRITTIPYGADPVDATSTAILDRLGLAPRSYLTLVARPEPENTVLEAVRGFSCRSRGVQLVVLGDYSDSRQYDRAIVSAASGEVRFLGAIYEPSTLAALRSHCIAYVHGHQVGGTNPSLVEALGAGNAVIAHDNRFNRWVAEGGALYFRDGKAFDQVLTRLLADPDELAAMGQRSRARFAAAFGWDAVLGAYERLLHRWWERALASRAARGGGATAVAAPDGEP